MNTLGLSEEEMSQFVLWLLLTRELRHIAQPKTKDADPSGKE